MAQRTLASTWSQYEKLAEAYIGETKTIDEILPSLNNNAIKANQAKIGSAISKLFLTNYNDFENTSVVFYIHDDSEEAEDYPRWCTEYNEETDEIIINPIGIFLFLEDCAAAEAQLTTPKVRRSFLRYRYFAFLTEIRKLPSRILMFMLTLQRVALTKKIADVETKGGVIEAADGEEYLTLLWAFKELETFLSNTNGINLRSEYKVSWYESDWSIGI